jgi:hypothetical protein
MLPALASRHLPQLCISRVNYRSVHCALLDDGIVVDANFSTLWSQTADSRISFAVLALMNSSWTQACLESMATVMGGGALKVEAAHLRAVPLPKASGELVSLLAALGRRLAQSNANDSKDVLTMIDEAVLGKGLEISNPMQQCEKLREFVAAKAAARKR